MSYEKIYNKVATSYDKIANHYDKIVDRYKLIPMSQAVADEQLMHFDWNGKQLLDMGIGSGKFLYTLKHAYPNAFLTGLDVSRQMLEVAKSKMEITTVLAGAEEADQRLKHHQYDLVLVHNILSYVDLETVLNNSKNLLVKGGCLSLITTTFESFPKIQNYLSEKSLSKGMINSVVKYFYSKRLKRDFVPKSYKEIEEKCKDKGFSILQRSRVCKEICFNNYSELLEFAVCGGWLTAIVSMTWLPYSVFYYLFKLYLRLVVDFPFSDKYISEVLLLQMDS